jgi:hypothetical protein
MDLPQSPPPAFTRLPTELLVSILEQQQYVTQDDSRVMYAVLIVKNCIITSDILIQCRLCYTQITPSSQQNLRLSAQAPSGGLPMYPA